MKQPRYTAKVLKAHVTRGRILISEGNFRQVWASRLGWKLSLTR